ncbi:5-dehydro-4-deoxy-D-glucuronate isomerase [Sinorhizobium numidicum]|uniref:4-deoxy-L-threo-5-hexosulose-uronate ketol-isomerase n=1 Tax=Sinorhizobium numidicum TaxID=680248 RepID=A0ABY8CRH7_9HYPH|nr:5-dehydro-4-deoxy-D-glucuronate isomerase [Sinorhizobium numidicum]WEX73930.1 5-dehydro-4-deoxy-D-glucuronate isomerase [Sinorhizobium numidicum]WEX79915.1 5-dehydro-4-deoxy-D-glucuronate isomerase [Sinorhizobium numidicum]
MTHTDYTIRFAVDPKSAARYDTAELREQFLLPQLFVPQRIKLHYTHYDRMIVGGAMPISRPLQLETIKPAGTNDLLARRELVAVNIGGAGFVTVDGERIRAEPRDMVYAGMGSSVVFESASPETPAKFYLLSAPAHARLPARHIGVDKAKRIDLGSPATSNERTIFQFIHPEGASTCQLVVGMTTLAAGSTWNTMPCHIHDRRMEAYLYFDLAENARVFHLMGEPQETRHLILKNEEAIVSPGWSIHSGVGTSSYSFIWAMAGDNVDYTDVDLVAIEDLR